MLLADRLLGVDGDEVEDQRERLVLTDDTCDEALIALDRIVDVGDVLTRLVEVRHARGGDALPRRHRRHGEIKHEVGPQQRLVQPEHPVEVESPRDVAGEAGEEEAIGDDQLPLPERREDDLLDPMTEIGAVQQRELLGAQRPDRFAALD